ncbi:MAG: adenylosuccinate synthase [Candidatus Thorarchaeota archaeon]
MQNLVVVGLQWGDEGKGKLVDYLSEQFDIVVRFQGGSNAGHTVIVEDKTFKFRIMPTGAVRGKKVVIGNGVVIDPMVLLDEIKSLENASVSVDLLISDRAHVITPYQILIDGLQEEERASRKVGTTKRGIGPAYEDKMTRVGIRVCDLISEEPTSQWNQMEATSLSKIEKLYSTQIGTSKEEIRSNIYEMIENLKKYIGDSGQYLETMISSGKRILFEGAQGALLDIDHGTYPFVTSSNCISSAAATGTGISFKRLDSVLGITKAYTTRVGTGPFPTELFDDIGERIRVQGKEFGTVTGRPRRCGWLDLVALRYAVRINGADFLAVTKLDVLNEINPIKLCVAYEIEGEEFHTLPASAQEYEKAIPVYEEMDGWDRITGEIFDELPSSVREYIAYIERYVNAKATILSIGPERSDTIDILGSHFRGA